MFSTSWKVPCIQCCVSLVSSSVVIRVDIAFQISYVCFNLTRFCRNYCLTPLRNTVSTTYTSRVKITTSRKKGLVLVSGLFDFEVHLSQFIFCHGRFLSICLSIIGYLNSIVSSFDIHKVIETIFICNRLSN